MHKIFRYLFRFTLFSVFVLFTALILSGFIKFHPPLPTADYFHFDQCNIDNKTFIHGEELVYKVYYNWNFVWLSAGEVVFTIKDLGEHYHLVAEGRTYRSYEWFFKVRDRYESIVDKNTLLPIEHIRDVNEGSFTLYDHLKFDQNAGTLSSFRGKTKDVAKLRTFNVETCMHDMISIIYFVRNFDPLEFAQARQVQVKIFMDNKEYPINIRHRGSERIKLRGSSEVNTIKYSPELIAGDVFKEGTEMIVYATDDLNRVPVMIESPVSVGAVKVILQSHSGLKYQTNLLN